MSPDDRLGDLGGGEGDRPDSAAERLEEEREQPAANSPPLRPPLVHRQGNKYAWAAIVVVLMGVGVLFVTTTLPNTGAGLKGPPREKVIPDFAAPLATSNVVCSEDEPCAANVCQKTEECNDQSGTRPACEVRGRSVLNICELRREPLVLTLLATEGTDCEPQLDRIERMRGEFPGVRFAAVMGGESREEIEQIVKRRGWGIPVGVDRDGAVLNLYGVGVCPTTVFVKPDGRTLTTELGNLTEAELRTLTGRLVAAGGR